MKNNMIINFNFLPKYYYNINLNINIKLKIFAKIKSSIIMMDIKWRIYRL